MSKAKLFISYKTKVNRPDANNLRVRLKAAGYNVWMDTSNLNGGERWDSQIYDEITSRDMVLLLLKKETADSVWVRREVDVARGARVYILPLLTEQMTGEEIKTLLSHFGLENYQSVDYTQQDEDQFADLMAMIDKNASKTRPAQEEWLAALQRGENKPMMKEPVKPFKSAYRAYALAAKAAPACRVYLAGGDMTQAKNIDVLVNSENNYMQMARIFESFTLSSKLRLHGSRRKADGRLVDDTVQQELNQQIKQPGGNFQIPIEWGCVVPTHAGHPDSNLAKNGARYIFHTVAVRVESGTKNNQDAIRAIDDGKIGEAVSNCLRQAMEINRSNGVISPPGTDTYAHEQEQAANYRPIRSIIFPLFGTGHGKRQNDIAVIGSLMFESIAQFVLDNADNEFFSLDAIHVCAYSKQDADNLEAELKKMKHLFKPFRQKPGGN